jgi:hypothetical protein
METLSGLWMPILLSAVLVFIASSVIWNVLGAEKWHVTSLPDEAGAMEALGKQGLAPGQYSFPHVADHKAMKQPAFQEKLKQGPVGLLILRAPGPINMATFLAQWFVYLLLVSYLVALVCGHTLHAGAAYMRVFRIAGIVAFAAYSMGSIPNAIWWGRPWKSALKEFVDGIVYALLTAGSFGWLWPR